jgi:hypothetical protein
MSTLKVTNLQNGSAPAPNMVLNADGSVTLTLTLDNLDVAGASDGDVLTFSVSSGQYEPAPNLAVLG